MSHFTKYGTREGEESEDHDPLLQSYSKSLPGSAPATEATKRFHPYTVVGLASAVVVGIILVAAVTIDSNSASSSAAPSKTSLALAKATAAASAVSTNYFHGAKKTSLSTLDETAQRQMFADFKRKFHRQYKSKEEEEAKFKNFQAFLGHIDERNSKEVAKNGKAIHGITRFADMSHDEFKKGYLTYKRNDKGNARKNLQPSPFKGLSKAAKAVKSKFQSSKKSKEAKEDTTATSVDWTGIYTTAVKDQGYCGSCWAFSATEQLESDSIRTGLLTTTDTLSAQQIVSCDSVDWGCGGGDTVTAYAYVYSAGGITSEAQYPYVSYWGITYECSLDDDTKLVKPTSYYQLMSEAALEEYVLTTGPVSVCLDASEWSSYSGGIITSCGMDVDHCVQLVGIDTEAGYYKVRNQWGTSWGDKGYIYLATGSNMCNIASEATYLDVVKVDSSR